MGSGSRGLLGLGALRLDVFPIMAGPLGPVTVLTPPIPMPSSITVEFLPPVDWAHLGTDAADDPAIVERCAAEVVGAMQVALNRLRVERPHPVARGVRNLVSRAWSR